MKSHHGGPAAACVCVCLAFAGLRAPCLCAEILSKPWRKHCLRLGPLYISRYFWLCLYVVLFVSILAHILSNVFPLLVRKRIVYVETDIVNALIYTRLAILVTVSVSVHEDAFSDSHFKHAHMHAYMDPYNVRTRMQTFCSTQGFT